MPRPGASRNSYGAYVNVRKLQEFAAGELTPDVRLSRLDAHAINWSS
jgi:hypothetical protein